MKYWVLVTLVITVVTAYFIIGVGRETCLLLNQTISILTQLQFLK